MASVRRANVAARRQRCVDFHAGRIRTPSAWSGVCNDRKVAEAAGAGSRLGVNKDSLQVRVGGSAARNQAWWPMTSPETAA